MFLVKVMLLCVGIAAVAFLAVRDYAAPEAGRRVYASLLPLSFLAGAVLVVASAGT